MPRFSIERTFATGRAIPISDEGDGLVVDETREDRRDAGAGAAQSAEINKASDRPQKPVDDISVGDVPEPTPRFVEIPASAAKSQLLIPGQSLDVSFEPRAGRARINVLCRARDVPFGTDGVQGKTHADPDHVEADKFIVRGLPVTIKVRKPGGRTETINLRETVFSGSGEPTNVTIDVPESLEKKTWRLSCSTPERVNADMGVIVNFVGSRHLIRRTRIPIAVLNNAASEVVKGLGLELRADGDKAFVDFSPDLKRFAGDALERREFNLPKFVGLDIELRTVTAEVKVERAARGRRKVFFEVFAIFTPRGKIDLPIGATAEFGHLVVRFRFEILSTRQSQGPRKLVYVPSVDIGFKVLEKSGTFKVFEDIVGFVSEVGRVLSRVAGKSKDVGVKDLEDLIKKIQDNLEKTLSSKEVKPLAERFLTEGMMKLAEQDNQLHDFLGLGSDLFVDHFDPQREEKRFSAPGVTFDKGADGLEPTADDVKGARLLEERIDHIVVLMMENRSFDHLLGHLALDEFGRRDVVGLDEDMTNPASRPGPPIGVKKQEETQFDFSPGHHFTDVLEQINDGAMDGFAVNFAEKHGRQKIDEVNPMGYYTGKTLPAYEFFAENYLICNHWYCSHPGPTWPNRFCAVSGRTPEVENLSADDARIGYVEFGTVFDRLDRRDWVNYEHDIAFLRMFNKYRLDDANIRPFEEFFDDVEAGLPLFTWIDPDYTDVIPVDRVANDDHPPADLLQGQRLVERVYNALRASPNWERTMLVITYDEHGGFFDHVPPPGTKANPDDAIAPVHRDGKRHLGPRVPTIVVSPWVAQEAADTRLEHTSIIKTVLLRKFGPLYPGMGRRVHQSSNLGVLLTETKPRLRVGQMPPVDPPLPEPPEDRIGPKPRPDDDFHEGMRRFGVSGAA
jgi:phospholipase C